VFDPCLIRGRFSLVGVAGDAQQKSPEQQSRSGPMCVLDPR
jgi:hypothetical protein